jgi:hypothetical protein
MEGATVSASADFHYYNWVDQFNTLGLGENVPIANGTGSDSLIALLPKTGEVITMRVPYPLGFYTRGLDGRIDDPSTGWKGRGVWACSESVRGRINSTSAACGDGRTSVPPRTRRRGTRRATLVVPRADRGACSSSTVE